MRTDLRYSPHVAAKPQPELAFRIITSVGSDVCSATGAAFARPSMVAQAGASKEALGRDNRYANPVWVATSEPGVSGGGVNLLITKRSAAYVSCP
ncbi:ash family protein [Enterobacter kobei]|uniref:ash family protein n=1 Tax=Enterobacter kobei TaxID=208224 RepID=UPI00298D2B34|nr:ash family protein [Enterobacter kobei]